MTRAGTFHHVALCVSVDRFSDRKIEDEFLPMFAKDPSVRTAADVRAKCAAARERGLEVFPPCDNTLPDGSCAGHEEPEEAIDPRITVFGVNPRGGRTVGIKVNGLTVNVFADGPEQSLPARELAVAILDAGELHDRAVQAKRMHAEETEALRSTMRRFTSERDRAEEALLCAAEGRRRFFGPVLCVPVNAGDWSGPVWLLDPEKQESGFGLRFESLLEVRALHPELWIVDVTERGVLLDSAKLARAT